MKQSINFMYDGVSSKDMGVHIAWDNKGLFEESFLPTRKIIEQKIANREKPYFQRVEHEPLSFSLSFAIADWENKDTLRRLAHWFFQPYYRPLVFDSNPNRVFYAMFEGEPTLFHNGLNEGYIELNVRCDSPYGYSHEQNEEDIEFRVENIGFTVTIDESNFNEGEINNISITSNGLKVGENPSKWGLIYSDAKKWGGIT